MLTLCQTSAQMSRYLAARASTLAPDSTDDPNEPFRLAANELSRNDKDYWAFTELAALQVRSGMTRDAARPLERSLAADGRPSRAVVSWLWLALMHQKMGEREEARRWLNKAVNWMDQQGGQMPIETPALSAHLHNWLEAHLLRQEAEERLR
jgi:Tfp pilus assembly protein PilF